MMEMYLYWTAKCEFIFESWRIYDDDHFLLFFGCVLSCLYSVLHIIFLLEGDKIQSFCSNNMPRRVTYSLYQFLLTISSMITMMLLMTMNGWVNLSVGTGYTIGYAISQYNKKNEKYSQVESLT